MRPAVLSDARKVADECTRDVMQYVKWANKTDLDDFWTDPKVKRLFKNHIYAMTSRTNVYNGKLACSDKYYLRCSIPLA